MFFCFAFVFEDLEIFKIIEYHILSRLHFALNFDIICFCSSNSFFLHSRFIWSYGCSVYIAILFFVQLLLRSGRSPAEALMILVPEAYKKHPTLSIKYPEVHSLKIT